MRWRFSFRPIFVMAAIAWLATALYMGYWLQPYMAHVHADEPITLDWNVTVVPEDTIPRLQKPGTASEWPAVAWSGVEESLHSPSLVGETMPSLASSGMLMCLGGPGVRSQVAGLYANVHALRHTFGHSDMGVEVWYVKPLPDDVLRVLESKELFHPPLRLRSLSEHYPHMSLDALDSYTCKPLAMAVSDFTDHLLFLDGDVTLVQDPWRVLLIPSYRETGIMLLWDRLTVNAGGLDKAAETAAWVDDFVRGIMANYSGPPRHAEAKYQAYPSSFWTTNDLFRGRGIHICESSVIIINKRIHERLFYYIVVLNTDKRDETLRYVWGDKEQLWIAAEAAEVGYTFSPWDVSAIGPAYLNRTCGWHAHWWPELPSVIGPPRSLYTINGLVRMDRPLRDWDVHVSRPHLVSDGRRLTIRMEEGNDELHRYCLDGGRSLTEFESQRIEASFESYRKVQAIFVEVARRGAKIIW